MKNISILLILSIFALNTYAQMLTVRDQLTGKPMEMVAVYNKDFSVTATTNATGKVDAARFSGVDTIYFRFIGYKTKKVAFSQLETKKYQIYLSADPVTLESFVVSATRWQQSKRDVPQKIVSIKPVDVQLENPQTSADMLALTGDVYMQKSQLGGGSPMIRGFATNRVLITVDNVRMNTAIFRSGNVQNVISVDPFAVQNTEVIFGPASVIYGSDAIGGVMNFYTLSPALSESDTALIKVNLTGRFASANTEKTGHLDAQVGFSKIAFLTGFTYSNFGDLRMGSVGPDDYLRPFYAARLNGKDTLLPNPDPEMQTPSGYDQYSFQQKVLFKPAKNLSMTYALLYSETSDYARYDRLLRPKGNGLRSAEWQYGPQKWLFNSVAVNYSKPVKIFDKAALTLARQDFEESRIDRDFNKKMRFMRLEDVVAYSLNADMEKNTGKNGALFYGGEYVHNTIGSSGTDINNEDGTSETGASRYPDGSTWQSLAAYLSYNLKAGDKLVFQAGARYNAFKIDALFDTSFYPFPFTEAHISNGALTGSAGCVYNPHESWRFAVGVSSGFRSPNIDDIGKVFDSSPGSVIVPNPNLRAENAYNIDVDIAKRFSDYIKVDVLAFYTLLQHALVRRDYTLNGNDSIMYEGEMSKVQAVQNASVATVKGIQAGIDISTPFGFSATSKYNIIIGEEELDDGTVAPLRHAPPRYGITRMMYTRDRLKISFYAIYNAAVPFEKMAPEQQAVAYIYAKDANGNPYTPAWTTYNTKIMYQINDNLSLSTGIENITDIRYKPYASGIAGPGRNFILSARASF